MFMIMIMIMKEEVVNGVKDNLSQQARPPTVPRAFMCPKLCNFIFLNYVIMDCRNLLIYAMIMESNGILIYF